MKLAIQKASLDLLSNFMTDVRSKTTIQIVQITSPADIYQSLQSKDFLCFAGRPRQADSYDQVDNVEFYKNGKFKSLTINNRRYTRGMAWYKKYYSEEYIHCIVRQSDIGNVVTMFTYDDVVDHERQVRIIKRIADIRYRNMLISSLKYQRDYEGAKLLVDLQNDSTAFFESELRQLRIIK